MDPKDTPNFHVLRPRPADPETIASVERLAQVWRNAHSFERMAHEAMSMKVREAKLAGHSYQQLADAVGVSIGTIQRMCNR